MTLKIFAIVPVKRFENGKSRLAPLLSTVERVKLCELLLDETLYTLKKTCAISEVIVVSSDKRAEKIAKVYGASFLIEYKEGGVNTAVAIADNYCKRADVDASIVIPQDLPLMTSRDIDIICKSSEEYEKCMIICPSLRYDGSNALLRKPSLLIKTYYDNNSFGMHITAAKEIGAILKIIHLARIMIDLDTIDDARNLTKESTMSQSILYLRNKLNDRY